MGNYDDHLTYGYAAYAAAVTLLGAPAIAGVLPLSLAAGLAILLFPAVMIGALFPDVDHHASRPHRALRHLTFAGGTLATFYLVFVHSSVGRLDVFTTVAQAMNVDPTGLFALTALLISLSTGHVLRFLVSYFRPPHRGITHRIRTGVILGAVFGITSAYLVATLSPLPAILIGAIIGGGFLIGMLSHLQCDRMLLPATTHTVRLVIGWAMR